MKTLSPNRCFAVLSAASLMLWFRPLLATLSLAIADDKYTHIILILPLVAALMFQEWKLHRQEFQSSIQAASIQSVALLLTLLIAVVARWTKLDVTADMQLSINMVGLVVWWIGSFTLCFGIRALRLFLFPLFFLFWMVPVPAFALNQAIRILQQTSAFAAQLLFSSAGVPVSRDGLFLSIPGLTVEVARECSSIRSSLMLVVTTMVLAQLFLRSPWRKLLVIVLALPLSVAKNGLRIFTIAMLGTRVDPGFLTGKLHHQGGIVFFLVALLAIALLLWILHRGEAKDPETPTLRPVGAPRGL